MMGKIIIKYDENKLGHSHFHQKSNKLNFKNIFLSLITNNMKSGNTGR